MKLPIRLVIVGIISAGVMSLALLQNTSAQSTLSDKQRQRIIDNCSTIKTTLNQLHASDALLRVNRGQIYESMSSNLMANFNARLNSNNHDIKGFQVVTNGYQGALNDFRSSYQQYERQLSAVIRIDCTKEPVAFHVALQDARSKREKVHDNVVRLHQYIDDYRSAVNDFLINYERLSGGR